MSTEELERQRMRDLIKEWKHPVPDDVVSLSKIKPKIETNCKMYAMIIFEDTSRPIKKATRGRSRSRSRSQTPTPITFKWLKENMPQNGTNSIKPTDDPTTSNGSISKPVKGIRKGAKPDPLGVLNLLTQSKRVRFREEVEVNFIKSNAKRKRAEDVEITAENIPLETILPTLEFGINKDICPKKKRRLQSLFPAES